jgi:outer membrane lipoprotein-sorting protein
MVSVDDDFQELLGLLSKAKERYRSVRAAVVHTVDGTLAKEANRRFIDWRLDQGSPGMGIIGKPGPPLREDFYHDYEDSEEWIRLWHQRPDLWREETRTPEGRLRECEVYGGMGGPRWIYDPPEWVAYIPRIDEQEGRDTQFSFMLDPSEYVFSETFWDGTTVNKTGREATLAGRECVEVRAETVSWGYPPYVFSTYRAASEGATDYLLMVNAEVGTILRVAARLEGRELRVAEVTEVAYNEEFPDDTFRLELPGVVFRRIDH